MQAGTWPNPPHDDEYAVRFDEGRGERVMIAPALFDEGNKLRRFTVETMRELDEAGVDSMLPDLPGTNESTADLPDQSLTSWGHAMAHAARHFRATHILTIRGGALCVPEGLPTLRFAPVGGPSLLRGLVRARLLTDREAGEPTTREDVMAEGRERGFRLAGFAIGPAMFDALERSDIEQQEGDIAQSEIGDSALWLRAEPAEDRDQSESLARIVAERLS